MRFRAGDCVKIVSKSRLCSLRDLIDKVGREAVERTHVIDRIGRAKDHTEFAYITIEDEQFSFAEQDLVRALASSWPVVDDDADDDIDWIDCFSLGDVITFIDDDSGERVAGVIRSINDDEDSLGVEREDGKQGDGSYLVGYGDLWVVWKEDDVRLTNASSVSSYNKTDKKGDEKMGSLVAKIRDLLLQEPDKSERKFGIKDSDNNLTPDGKDLYIAWRYEKDREDFNKDFVKKLKDAEAKERK